MLKNCIFIKTELYLNIFFKDFAVVENFLQVFEDWASTYLAGHLLMTGTYVVGLLM